jgi:hypothetical protein
MDFMDCPKWQETGLLFGSGEANAQQSEEFKEHLKLCADCKNEAEAYLYDKHHFFQRDMLAESPSEAISRKIVAACSQKPVTTLGFSLFSGMWMRSALTASLLLAFGVGVGFYFTMNYSNKSAGAIVSNNGKAGPAATPIAQKSSPSDNNVQLAKVKSGVPSGNNKDSLKQNESAFSSSQKARGNIIPVVESK